MDYIEKLINEKLDEYDDGISLSSFLVEQSFITKYLSRKIKATSLSLYHVLFYLSFYKTGRNEITISSQEIAGYLASDRNDGTIDLRKSRFTQLIQLNCIKIDVGRGGANTYTILLPSEIPFCLEMIELEKTNIPVEEAKNIDYYNDLQKKLLILKRDQNKCQYCFKEINEKSFFADHIIPMSKGGTNFKSNLISSCHDCNNKKKDKEVFEFLIENYRLGFLTQQEYLKQKEYIELIKDE